MKKQIFVGMLGAAALVLLLPQGVQAAENVVITQPVAGDTSLTMTCTDASASDRYQIYINNSRVDEGTLDASGDLTQTYKLDKALAQGDAVLYYVTGPEGSYVPYKATAVKRPEPQAPTSMTASAATVQPAQEAEVTVTFDPAYVPDPKDALEVTSYNKEGNILDIAFTALPDTAAGQVSQAVKLEDAQEGNYYVIDFIPAAGGKSPVASLRVDVKGQASPADPDDPGNNTPSTADGELDKAVSMEFTYPSNSVSLGESASPTLKLVYADGSRHDYAGAVQYSYGGNAVVEGSFDKGRFSVSSDPAYVGSKVQVTAMAGTFSRTVELTVVANDKSFILTPAAGAVGTANKTEFQLADGNKNFLRLLWQPTVAQVVAKPLGDTGAAIVGTVTDMSTITTSGKGTLTLTSDKATAADVYVIFRDGESRMFETAHTTYTFSGDAPAPAASHAVELFIGSRNYTVDGQSGVSDTEAVILKDRTFIPLRLAAEALGAQVNWKAEDQSITVTYNGHEIVMRIGSDSYTVDGVSQKMDVQPYIDSNDRTMVPVRFMGEGLGCTVEAVAGDNGLTRSVTIRS